jgi:glycosyltransferase involved in cell wall biosynthesis
MRHEHPIFSIVVPTYERPAQLAACLQSLSHLEYPLDRFEVIVVDDGSETPLEPVVTPFRNGLDLTLLTQSNAGPAAARNTGAARAKGKFLAFTDDDCTPAPDWLQALQTRFAVTPDHMIGGRTLNALPDNPYSATSQLIQDAVYTYYNDDPNQTHFFATNNVAMPADYFHAISGFDTTFPFACEDREFCARWQHHAYGMTYAPEAMVYHAHRLTLRSFWKQHFNYGRGTFHYYQVRTRHGWDRVKADPKFYLHLFRYPFLHIHSRRALFLEALLIVSHIAKTAGFLSEKIQRTDWRAAGQR